MPTMKRTLDNDQMLDLRLDGATYAAIGRAAGVSRQRVQQILQPPSAIRVHVVARYKGLCTDCGIHVGASGQVHHRETSTGPDQWNDLDNLELLCKTCHRLRHPNEPLPLGYRTEPPSIGGTTARVLKYIRAYLAKHKYAPLLSEIAEHCRLANRSGVRYHLDLLERRGLIGRGPRGTERAITLEDVPA